MSENVLLQLKKLVDERKVKRDAKPKNIKEFGSGVITERKLKVNRGDKIIEKILKCLD